MTPMALISWVLLLFLAALSILATSGAHGEGNLTLRCHPDQAANLLQLKKSFSFFRYPNALESWQVGTDCCLWEGVGCSKSSGHVSALELSGRALYSPGLDTAIFNLVSLQRLDLSLNCFGGFSLPATGFERFSLLTHLNLSNSGFQGQIPVGIGRLASLISLDLSTHYDTTFDDSGYGDYASINGVYNVLWLDQPNFQILVANLSNMRELYLDGVYMSSSGDWCHDLVKSLPDLHVLSLSSCNLDSPICPSLSTLHSLTVINLEENYFTPASPFPEIFMDFPNLSVLKLAHTNLQGVLPRRTFQSKTLRVLDLSRNQDLSGHVPNLSNASSIEIMMLAGANISFAKPVSFSNFNSLKTFSLDVNFVSVEPQSSLGVLGSLQHLELSNMDSERDLGPIFSWIGDLLNLPSLKLYMGNLSRTSFSSVAKLKSLRSLEILNCIFSGPIPSAIGNLTNLKSLKINGCEFLGSIPSSIGNLRNLRNLEINGETENYGILAGSSKPIPAAIGNLSNLESLHINYCGFSGTIPDDLGLLKKLIILRIGDCNLSGRIPNSIVNLTRLIGLDLSFNLLKGELPASVFSIPTLQQLDISSNQLSGSIQDFDATSSRMVYVDLSTNQLTGNIPKSFFQLKSLAHLDIGWNNFVGSVDLSSFWRLQNLAHLGLSNNNLSVIDIEGEGNNSPYAHLPRVTRLELAGCSLIGFPSSLAHLNQMSYLDLSCNRITGTIPKWAWGTWNQMSHLDLSCNRITGTIPKWIWATWNSSLTYLNLSHNMLSSMQLTSYVLPFNQLNVLDLSSNQFKGQIPMPPRASVLDYSNNCFSSVLPDFTLYLGLQFKISRNNISGHIPNSICDSRIDVLDLSYNNFSGQIPSCLIEDGSVSVLSLRNNQFEGVLPNNIKDQCQLHTLDLNNNKIEGKLPMTLTKCLQLQFLDFGNNHMVGTFPSWLGNLPRLRVLVLRSNRFYGSMDGDLHRDDKSREYFSSLQILDVASNNFSGNLSPKWFVGFASMMAELNTTGYIISARNLSVPVIGGRAYQDTVAITYKSIYRTFDKILTTLTVIDLSNNSFDGKIPVSLGRLVSLLILNMSGNAFTGVIPREFGGMTLLESLDLSQNQLSGDIPEALTNLSFLGILNLRNNQLVGRIPKSVQFSTFQKSSFEGNLGLCGPPLSSPCGVSPATPSAVHVEKSSHVDVYLFLFVGLGFGVGFSVALLMRWGSIGEWFVKSARVLWP